MSKHYALFITCNNWTTADRDALIAEKYDYKLICREICPTTGTPHLHCYIYLKDKIRFNAFKKRNPRCNIQEAEGTAEHNLAYLSKTDKDIEIYGTMPKQGKRNDLQKIKDMVKDGKTMSDVIENASNFQCLRTAEILLKYIEPKRNYKTEVIYIWGMSETGKTRYAYDKHPDLRIHKQNALDMKWWQGYDAHEIVIIDEVDMNTSYSQLKSLCDRYPHIVECKGGSRQFLAKKIYITSLVEPKELFQYHPESGKEMLRRIDKIIHLK